MIQHGSDQHAGAHDLMLDADEIQTLEHGGYGGEQEYMDSSTATGEVHSHSDAATHEYVNQTDMADQTGDQSLSEPSSESR